MKLYNPASLINTGAFQRPRGKAYSLVLERYAFSSGGQSLVKADYQELERKPVLKLAGRKSRAQDQSKVHTSPAD